MIWFLLWREFKLSIAEIISVFSNGRIIYLDRNILVLDDIEKQEVLDKASFLWWTIKIIDLYILDDISLLNEEIFKFAKYNSWKFNYSISVFWWNLKLEKILISCKKYLKNNNISSRFINKDFKNTSSAQITWEKLIDRWTDFNVFSFSNSVSNNWENKKIYFWKTIWVQDIDSYSKRDYSKTRDMQTGMLPPKLAQIMINISWSWKEKITYDPFVWLWTVLIESVLMWNKEVYWSDLSDNMVLSSIWNLKNLKQDNNLAFNFDIKKLNAKFIYESEILKSKKNISIVTEWYLWEMMTRKNISLDRIDKQRKSLEKLYESFFSWLKKIWFTWNIVISFPFWEYNKKYYYFEEIYNILKKYSEIISLFPKNLLLSNQELLSETKQGSLLYKRKEQLVWREIFKLKIK